MVEHLLGKHAFITGGGTGVGAAIALELAAHGANVTVVGRREGPLEDVASQSDRVTAAVGDVTDEDSLRGAFAAARDTFGPIHIAVANAGIAESSPAVRTSLDFWNRIVSVNLTGAFLTAREALPDMLEAGWGRIIFMSSIAGLRGHPYVSAYCASKHGVIGLTRSLALELARKPITVNAVCPGYVDTPMLDHAVSNIVTKTGRSEDEARASLLATNPQGRFIETPEVAATVNWLCLDASRSVNGQAISLSGGDA